MFCPNCGNQCPDGTKFCQSCGAPLTNNQQQNTQPNYGNQQNYYQQPNQQYQQPNYNQYQYADPYNGHPMGWYKFLIYFALFAGAFFDLCYSVLYLTGNIYSTVNVDPNLVYSFYPGMKVVDIIYGVLMIAVVAFMVVTRFQLSGMKKNGPKMVIALYIINLVLAIVYAIATSFVTGKMAFDSSTIVQFVISIVMAIVNKVYFDKRKDLFVK